MSAWPYSGRCCGRRRDRRLPPLPVSKSAEAPSRVGVVVGERRWVEADLLEDDDRRAEFACHALECVKGCDKLGSREADQGSVVEDCRIMAQRSARRASVRACEPKEMPTSDLVHGLTTALEQTPFELGR